MKIGGLVSGLDTQGLIDQLMQLERAPVVKLQQKQQVLKWKKEAMMDFRSNLMSLQTKVSDLVLSSAFNSKAVSAGNDKIVTATANTSAPNGTYNVTVNNLASATRVASTGAIGFIPVNPVAATMTSSAEMNTTPGVDVDPNAKFADGMAATMLEAGVIADGTKGITVNGVYIAIASDDTLNTVINKITDSAAGVTASLSGDKLTLQQKTPGSQKKINISDTSGFLTAVKIAAGEVSGQDNGYQSKLGTSGLVVNSGNLTINNYTIAVDVTKDSLQDVINRINSSAAGVTAFYDTATDTVSFASKTTGSQLINFGLDTTGLLGALKVNPGAQAAGNQASITVNGTTITRDSNVFDYNGIKITAQSVGATTVTVNQDTEKAIATIEEFVKQFNSTIDFINTKLAEKKVSDPKSDSESKQGLLSNEYLLRNTRQQLQKSISEPVSGLPSNMNMLALVGITTSAGGKGIIPDGKLVIDKEKLSQALETNAQAVQDLFTNGTSLPVTENLTGAQGVVNGTTVEFQLANMKIAGSPAPIVKVNSTAYTQVSSNPGVKQFMVDYAKGKIIFNQADAPAAGDTVDITYEYMVTSGPTAGIAVRLKQQISDLTKIGGYVDTATGNKGGLTSEIDTIGKSIERYEDRLAIREETLWKQFTAMEKALGLLQSQGDWLSGQLNNLPGWGTSKK